jgi:hypothetical protein
MRRKWLKRSILAGVAVVLVAGVAAPFVSGARFKNRIREALERGLDHPVTIAGEVHFTLFSGPGVIVEDVLIADDPSAGLEPFAHVSTLTARVALSSLWTGRLEFGSLVLDEPSVNLVKTSASAWNIQPLVRRAIERGHASPVPNVYVRGGRINFKFGDTKSVFYLAGADVDLYAAQDGTFQVRFEGNPARTDRAAQSFGRISGRGTWQRKLDLAVSWERSSLAEVAMLVAGRDSGVHGAISGTARIAGELSALNVKGRLQIEDLHRWDMLPLRGGAWPVTFTGRIDLPGERIEMSTAADLPVSLRLRGSRFLTQADYGFIIDIRELPATPVIDLARYMGVAIPGSIEIAGRVAGVVGYSSREGLGGQIVLLDGSAKAPSSSPVTFEKAHITVAKGKFQLAPATIYMQRGQSAQVEGSYSIEPGALEVRIATRSLRIGELQSGTGRLFGASSIPLLDNLRDGTWRGALTYRWDPENEGYWTGAFDVQSTRANVPGISESVRFRSASASIRAARIVVHRMQAAAGDVEFEGEYRYEPTAERPHHFRIRIPAAEPAELEHLLTPALRRRRGFLARTLRWGGEPEWLTTRKAEGTIQIGTLDELADMNAHVVWLGSKIELAELEASIPDEEPDTPDHFRGQGGFTADGKLVLELTNGKRQLRIPQP